MSTASKKTPRRKTVLDLEANDCRWPIGEPRQSDFHFCGKPSADGRPYCAHHWSLAFQPAKPRNQAQRQQPLVALPATARAA